jgi:SAM-dependent methyltransferase
VGRLVDDADLADSPVVANNAMNRERGLTGVNSYERELDFAPLAHSPASWLDLCCGSGRALIDAARAGVDVTGVDLTDFFDRATHGVPGLTLVTASVATWSPPRALDLITCVHGLHYVGDKLGVLTRVLSWLAPNGLFRANLDLASIRTVDGEPLDRKIRRHLKAADITYDVRRRLLSCHGPRTVEFPYAFVGADDTAGPNYTGQPAVDSIYRPIRKGTAT